MNDWLISEETLELKRVGHPTDTVRLDE